MDDSQFGIHRAFTTDCTHPVVKYTLVIIGMNWICTKMPDGHWIGDARLPRVKVTQQVTAREAVVTFEHLGGVFDLPLLGAGHVVREDPGHAPALVVDLEHQVGGLLAGLVEQHLEHPDDELHGRVVVVEEDDRVHGRALDAHFFNLDAANHSRLGRGHFTLEACHFMETQGTLVAQRNPGCHIGAAFFQQEAGLTTVLFDHAVADEAIAHA